MAIHKLRSDKIKVEIDSKGAELLSLKMEGNDHNWIWGAGEVWRRRAPLLFPIVGRLLGDCYTYNSLEYSMAQHGFARDLDFAVEKYDQSSVTFSLTYDASTMAIYPFKFALKVQYTVQDDSLKVNLHVENVDQQLIYFNAGWHPGFVAPWGDGSSVIKCHKVFGERRYLHGGYLSERVERFDENVIKLSEDLFAEDALVFLDLYPQELIWMSEDFGESLTINCGAAPHLGVWTKDLSQFLCLEPWWGYADLSKKDCRPLDLKDKSGVQCLKPGDVWSDSCTLSIKAN